MSTCDSKNCILHHVKVTYIGSSNKTTMISWKNIGMQYLQIFIVSIWLYQNSKPFDLKILLLSKNNYPLYKTNHKVITTAAPKCTKMFKTRKSYQQIVSIKIIQSVTEKSTDYTKLKLKTKLADQQISKRTWRLKLKRLRLLMVLVLQKV